MKKRLQNYIEQVRGISYTPEDISETPMENYIPVLKANNIQDGKLDTTSLIYIDKAKVKPEQLIRKGDLLIAASSGSKEIVGKSVFFENEFYGSFGAFCKIIRPKENIYPGYVNAFFKTTEYKRHIKKVIQGANINNLRTEDIDSLLIPDFSFHDQIRIATLLSKVEALITQRKESLKLLDEYVKSVFAEMFGDPVKNEKKWDLKLLKNISDVGSSKRVFVEELLNEGIPFYRGTEIGHLAEGINVTPSLFISELHYQQLKAHTGVPKIGDLLMPSICPDGRIYRVANNNPFYFKDGRVLWLNVNQYEINSLYLQSTLKTIFRTNYKSIASGTTFAELKIVALKQIKIPIPPKNLQVKYSLIVEKAEFLINRLKSSLADLENFYGSLSQKAFNGELDLDRIKSKSIDEELERALKDTKRTGAIDKQPKTDEEDARYGDPFEVDEPTAKKQGPWFYNEWLRLHGKIIQEENESVWLQSKRSGLRPTTIKFNSFEGNAIIHEVFSKQNTGFGFSEFESTLKSEKIVYTTKEVKEFIFKKLEQKELVQYYATKEWMEAIRHPKFNPPGGPEFSGEGSIWFLVNKTDKAK